MPGALSTVEVPRTIGPRGETRSAAVAVLGRSLLNEASKGLVLLWRHSIPCLPTLISVPPLYLVLQFIVGNGRIDRALVPPTLVAFAFYPILYVASYVVVGDLLEEVNTGTFGQVHLGAVPPVLLLAGRLVPLFSFGGVLGLVVLAEAALALGVVLTLPLAALLPAALTILDLAGFAFLLCGLALVLPRIGAILHLVNGLVFTFNGSFFPVALWPGWVQVIARVLPTTLGIEATQQVVLHGQSLGDAWASGLLPLASAHAVALVSLGIVVFLASDRRAMRRGTLG